MASWVVNRVRNCRLIAESMSRNRSTAAGSAVVRWARSWLAAATRWATRSLRARHSLRTAVVASLSMPEQSEQRPAANGAKACRVDRPFRGRTFRALSPHEDVRLWSHAAIALTTANLPEVAERASTERPTVRELAAALIDRLGTEISLQTVRRLLRQVRDQDSVAK
jgi:hypothetical protein